MILYERVINDNIVDKSRLLLIYAEYHLQQH